MRTITISLMLVLLVVCGMAVELQVVQAGYNYEEPLGPDIIDGLMQIPPHVAKQYGKTDKVRLVSNIAELLTASRGYEARIKALEQLVKKLEKRLATLELLALAKAGLMDTTPIDPNEVG